MAGKQKALDTQVGGGHYKDMRIQPIEFGMANQLNMCQALALRYITRNKGGFLKRIEEREKAIHCIQLEIDFIKADMALPTEERVALRRHLIAKLESEIKEIQMSQQTENTVTETVDEVADIGTDKPATQTVGVDGGATAQEEQSMEERIAAINASKEEAKKVIDETGEAGFILIAMQGNGTAKAMLAGDYATVVHAAHTAVCALGSIVKQIQGEHDGNPEKHAKVEDFTAGASVLTIHHGMLAKMHADQVAEATVEAAASVKQ